MTTHGPGRIYRVAAVTNGDGSSTISTKRRSIDVDSSPLQGEELPGPADLLTAALAACVLKNVARFGETLRFDWREARIEVEAERQDTPPKITRLHYRLELDTDEPDHRVELLHRNITKHGTITNTLAAACDVTGEIVAVRSPGPSGEHAALPDGLELVRTTEVFDNASVPAGLLRAHRVADGVWARLVVHAGAVRFVFEDEPDRPIIVATGGHVVIPPARRHHVELDGPARFAVEFHRAVAAPALDGVESTGLLPDDADGGP
jgi:uncharacterized OsmC-like protein/tellurite resistance-related uncharacterized protein